MSDIKPIRFDDLNPGDKIKVFLRDGENVVGKYFGIVKGKPEVDGEDENTYYMEVSTKKDHIYCIDTHDIFRVAIYK